MNILVTGSNGFIGDHVCRYLKGKGHYIIGLGRKKTVFDGNHVNEYVQCDLSTEETLKIADKVSVRIDAVVHLAADMRKEPHCVEVIAANCCGTQRLLEMCENKGIKVLVQLSSLPVIGHPVEHPITENHPLSPYTVYHITKRTEELLANYAFAYHGIRTASFRISAIIRVLGSQSQIVLSGIDPADEYVWDASLDKLKRDSGYEPEGNIENMIREYADWIKSQG